MPRVTGTYESVSVGGENVQAFVPDPLPPARTALKLTGALGGRIRDAERALSNLQTAGQMVPPIDGIAYTFVRKEAVVSSQIEGTQASLTDLLSAEADAPSEAAPEDVEDICNYLEALDYARNQLRRSKGLPLSLRLLNGAHRRLLSGARGENKKPGSVRRSQNWIGGTRPGKACLLYTSDAADECPAV